MKTKKKKTSLRMVPGKSYVAIRVKVKVSTSRIQERKYKSPPPNPLEILLLYSAEAYQTIFTGLN
jgi:hypothetical protein